MDFAEPSPDSNPHEQSKKISNCIQEQLTSFLDDIKQATGLPETAVSFHRYTIRELVFNAFDAALINHRDISRVQISIGVNLVHTSDDMQTVEINLEGQKPQMCLGVKRYALLFSIVDNGTGVSTTMYGDVLGETDLKRTLIVKGLPLLGGHGRGLRGVRESINNKGGFLHLLNKPENWGEGALVYYLVPVE